MSGEVTRYALRGRVVTMRERAKVLDDGVVYVAGDSIVDVRDAAAVSPDGFASVPVVRWWGCGGRLRRV